MAITRPDPFDALIVGCYEGDKPKFVVKIRNLSLIQNNGVF
ncbi:MAG: hypothetical protein ACXWYD_14465 [Candidatus Binatia bacterium]